MGLDTAICSAVTIPCIGVQCERYLGWTGAGMEPAVRMNGMAAAVCAIG